MRESAWVDDFEEYFHARSRHLRRTAFALTGDWQLAEDLTQTTFLRLYRHWPRIRKLNIDAYARRVLTNAFLDGRKHRPEVPTGTPPDNPASDGTLDDRLDLAAALAALAPQMRAVIVLRYLEDLPVRDVAATLDIAEGTVKSHTSHALEALRAHASSGENPTRPFPWGATS